MGERRDKRKLWREWIQLWSIWYIVRTFVNAIMYLQHNNKKVWTVHSRTDAIWLFLKFYYYPTPVSKLWGF
jgi:hypothetical protein